MAGIFQKFKGFVIILGCLLSPTIYAMSLEQAKEAGYIGEQYNGYVGTTQQAPSHAASIASNVNAKRKSHYQKISASTGASIQNVELLAGEKAIAKTPAGQYIKPRGSGWVRK